MSIEYQFIPSMQSIHDITVNFPCPIIQLDLSTHDFNYTFVFVIILELRK
jgi:hypothetical protein